MASGSIEMEAFWAIGGIECVFHDSIIASLQRVTRGHHHSAGRASEALEVFVRMEKTLDSHGDFPLERRTLMLSGRAFAVAESAGSPRFAIELGRCGIT